MSPATIDDVARLAGVTKGSVSLAYSGKRKISAATKDRIFAAAAELDWTPSSSARALATKRSHTIGIVLFRDPKILASDAFFPSFLAGVEQSLAAHEMALMLQVVMSEESELKAYKTLARGRSDGVILLDVETVDRRIAWMAELALPAVVVGYHGGHTPLDQVYADDERSMREVLDHLIGLGHTRIAHVAGPHRYIHSTARRTAFIRHLDACGLDSSQVYEADFTAESARSLTRRILRSPEPPTAITYANDVMAIAGMSCAQHLGRTIPDELSITGFDDSELSAHLSPPLTTVATDAFTRGVKAAESLVATLGGHPLGDLELDCNTLITRASTGRVPTYNES